MDDTLYHRFFELAREKAGIALRPGKESLVQARIAKRMRALGIEDPREYLQVIENDPTGQELVGFLDVISTNYTRFFREPDHFAVLEQELGGWLRDGQRRLRIWCAASSTGEEPYSLAITILEKCQGLPVDVKILATDISTQVLTRARAGEYGPRILEQVPANVLSKWFTRSGRKDDTDATWSVRPELRAMILFKRLNLSTPPFPMRGPLDAVFCRNVMIYFDADTRQALLLEALRLLRPGGLLVIGHSETLGGLQSELEKVGPSSFRKPLDASNHLTTRRSSTHIRVEALAHQIPQTPSSENER